MNKRKLIASTLFVFIFIMVPITFAQEYVIPEPVCIDSPEIPCPGRGHSYEKAQKPVSNLEYDVPTGFSKLFNYLNQITTKIGNTLNYTYQELREWFGNVYDKIIKGDTREY